MSHRSDEPAYFDPKSPTRCRICKNRGEDCKCVGPGEGGLMIEEEDGLWKPGS